MSIAGFPLLLFSGLVAGGDLQPQSEHHRGTPAVEGKALDATPESRVEAAQGIDAAVAAALIGAIAAQFGERKVEVKLDHLKTDPVSLVDLAVAGDGRLRIGDDDEWLPLRFEALYDSVAASVVQPRLTVGGDGRGEPIAVGSSLGRQLQARVADRLHQEFAGQPASLRLDSIARVAAGRRYDRLEGVGAVDFAREGSSVAQVRALYDRNRQEWLQVAYELGASAAAGGPEPLATP